MSVYKRRDAIIVAPQNYCCRTSSLTDPIIGNFLRPTARTARICGIGIVRGGNRHSIRITICSNEHELQLVPVCLKSRIPHLIFHVPSVGQRVQFYRTDAIKSSASTWIGSGRAERPRCCGTLRNRIQYDRGEMKFNFAGPIVQAPVAILPKSIVPRIPGEIRFDARERGTLLHACHGAITRTRVTLRVENRPHPQRRK